MFCLVLFCRLTGFTIPPPFTSSGSIFSLRLTSDFAVSAHGFKVAYEGKGKKALFFWLVLQCLLKQFFVWHKENMRSLGEKI